MLPNFLDLKKLNLLLHFLLVVCFLHVNILRFSKAVNAYFIGVKKLDNFREKGGGTDGDLTKSVD